MNKTLFLILITLAFLTSCGTSEEKIVPKKQLNLSILLDLSDRIEPSKNPMQIKKDSIVIRNIVGIFKNFIKSKGTYSSNDKINFYFLPAPQDQEIMSISEIINIDMHKMDVPNKKRLFQNFEEIYAHNINQIYTKTIKERKYIGSDTYRFIVDGAADKCIIDDSNYINILIIFTDGYLYFKNSLNKIKNRYSYLGPASDVKNEFRNKSDWKTKFINGDFGFIAPQINLEKLNVLIVEVNPINSYPQDFDIIKMFWTKWFVEMNINEENIKILKTDLPNNTSKLVENYFKKILGGK